MKMSRFVCQIVSVALATMSSAALQAASSVSSEVINDVKWSYEIVGGDIVIGGGRETAVPEDISGTLVIPDAINGKPVRRIGDRAFRRCRRITAVTIPASVTSIGRGGAFFYCRELTSVKMLGDKPSVGGKIFDNCDKLAAIHVLANAKSWAGLKEWQGIPLVFDAESKK